MEDDEEEEAEEEEEGEYAEDEEFEEGEREEEVAGVGVEAARMMGAKKGEGGATVGVGGEEHVSLAS